MKLTFSVLGFELAVLQLETPQPVPAPTPLLDKGVKSLSKHWVERMLR
ncbi:DUF7429 family protein [Mycolicibacterium septicum]|nr:hypothetical protein [Mycolicibacterium septicum]QRY51840.1 hypothetical protein JVX95_31450 [Mycolicibacterium septicum]